MRMLSVRKILLLTLVLGACHQGSKGSSSNEIDLDLPLPGGNSTFVNRTSGAFTFPAPDLSASDLVSHAEGDSLFDTVYISQSGQPSSGLGPHFNNVSCRSCHIKNGRGMPVIGDDGALRSPILMRISIDPAFVSNFPGSEALPGEGPYTVPGLGAQLQDYSNFGYEPEAKVKLSWSEESGTYADGTSYSLRRPKFSFTGANAELLTRAGVLHSLRLTPPVFGLGLLEAISDEQILIREDVDDKNGDGISGRVNRVWNPETSALAIGRFGWKASAPTILAQTSGAFAEDMGVTNPLHPATDGSSDITLDTLQKTAFYTQTLAVPARSELSDKSGLKIFKSIGCESCHVSRLVTGSTHPIASLRDQEIAPFTDLLLHDMGEGLADNRPDYLATGREWKTPALWGIGLTQTVLPASGFLHDGRARTLEEAILWHGGEAQSSQEKFKKLSSTERKALIQFLKSL